MQLGNNNFKLGPLVEMKVIVFRTDSMHCAACLRAVCMSLPRANTPCKHGRGTMHRTTELLLLLPLSDAFIAKASLSLTTVVRNFAAVHGCMDRPNPSLELELNDESSSFTLIA